MNCPPALVHPRLDLVDGRLRGFELFSFLDDRARFVELPTELGGRVGATFGAAPTPHCARDEDTRDAEPASKQRDPGSHGADATLASLPASPRVVPPERRTPAEPTRPKGDNGNLNDYEVLLLLDPDLEEDRQNEIVARTRETVERGGGTWGRHDAWGQRKLAYEIGHRGEGSYHLLLFGCDPDVLDEISRVLRITDGVLRHLAVRPPKGATHSAASAPSAPEPAAEPEAVHDGS